MRLFTLICICYESKLCVCGLDNLFQFVSHKLGLWSLLDRVILNVILNCCILIDRVAFSGDHANSYLYSYDAWNDQKISLQGEYLYLLKVQAYHGNF